MRRRRKNIKLNTFLNQRGGERPKRNNLPSFGKGSALKASVAKFGERSANEDYAYGDKACIALSDGAGGCGLYADRWSKYLVEQLDKKHAIASYDELDGWVDQIWQPFYDECEAEAQKNDAMLLNKFYNEGSCATLVAAWLQGNNKCQWVAYGDSLLFRYSRSSGQLWHTFTRLADFENPPYLISCKDPLTPEGFSCGTFDLDEGDIIFAASDALSHFVLMMYQVSKWDDHVDELEALVADHTTSSQLVQIARAMSFDFYQDVMEPLMACVKSDDAFTQQLKRWYDDGLIELDDFTVVFLKV